MQLYYQIIFNNLHNITNPPNLSVYLLYEDYELHAKIKGKIMVELKISSSMKSRIYNINHYKSSINRVRQLPVLPMQYLVFCLVLGETRQAQAVASANEACINLWSLKWLNVITVIKRLFFINRALKYVGIINFSYYFAVQ